MYMAVILSRISSISGERKKICGMNIHTTIAGTMRHALRSVYSLKSTSSHFMSVFSVIFTVIGTNRRWHTVNAIQDSNNVNTTNMASVIYTAPEVDTPEDCIRLSAHKRISSILFYHLSLVVMSSAQRWSLGKGCPPHALTWVHGCGSSVQKGWSAGRPRGIKAREVM